MFLKSNKSFGYDGVSIQIIQLSAKEIFLVATYLYEQAL